MRVSKTMMGLAWFALSLLSASSAFADGFLCPKTGRWILIGDSSAVVLKRCGPPTSREDVMNEGCTTSGRYCFGKIGERWVYDFDSTYLVRYLLFINGRLTQIQAGEYGEIR